jgi:electron transfer flavoprotein alpha subunit
MNILTVIDNRKNQFKKSDFELVYYSYLLASKNASKVIALILGNTAGAGILGKYGANEVYGFDNIENYDTNTFASLIADFSKQCIADLVVLPHNSSGKPLLGTLAVKLNAASVSGVINIPDIEGNSFIFKKGTYSSKAYSYVKTLSEKVVITLMQNSFSPIEVASEVSVIPANLTPVAPRVKVVAVEKAEGKVPLTESDIIVSGGRGLRGPENWGVLLDLASELGASTACSRPVSDVDWRPHSEHVGQTGIVVRPNLYIALGISGAIQHLAGVINSKTIVVINKDPEAPFFKAADYGIIGDLFEVVPKLTEAIRKYKSGTL